ncbi:SDR family oxidoreductase [Phenylobacterium montanum]|uniref:SDR family oxidoreductase n=1 Tax=Phenylobacterium montanum TaxID=2823693 RepID=A0A975IUG2_9CAUL|nr:SDR family oxidoreductase [Caulobacter sp. S6]QUD87494.1 SDR family oxidoreductase [Caulobacter sp. S6]
MRLLLFGPGYSGLALTRRLLPLGWTVRGAVRSAEAAGRLRGTGIEPVDIDDTGALAAAAQACDALLVTAPPDEQGCPAFAALAPILRAGARPRWTGYLSTTGVYGDRGGGWVNEASALNPVSEQGRRRVAAERAWLDLGETLGLTVAVFRLPGLYGPGRSALDRVRAGTARRTVKPGQVFSRLHIDDLAAALVASITRPRAGAIYNLCDDEPSPPQDVIAHAAELLGVPAPPEEPYDGARLGAASRRFFEESKRVSNALAKAELGWRPAYPSYREGLAAIRASEQT